MTPNNIKYWLVGLFLYSLCANVYSQSNIELLLSASEIASQNFTQIFTDPRDGLKYPLLASKDRYWINTNLKYKTQDSDCLNDKESNCLSLGRLYSWEEAQDVCPTNWKMPNEQDFKNLFQLIASNKSTQRTFLFPYTWENFNKMNPAKIRIQQNGSKHKKKYSDHNSFNLWLRSDDTKVAYYINGYSNKKISKTELIIQLHDQESKKLIQSKKKLGVRCVIPITEYNKLTFGNG